MAGLESRILDEAGAKGLFPELADPGRDLRPFRLGRFADGTYRRARLVA